MNHFKYILFLVFYLSVSCCNSKSANTEKIIIATASNMQFAIKEITKAFSTQTGIECDLVISSSGKLTAQIIEGAPYDLFISADMKYPKKIHENGIGDSGPRVYAYGKLVLWTHSSAITPSLEILSTSAINHIAIANPKTAPYGFAAQDVINNSSLMDKISNKLVYGESISQVNQFIQSGAADIGFTAQSVVLSSHLKDKGKWVAVDSKIYTPIEQGVIILNRNQKNLKSAQKFYTFLFSAESKQILENFGYSVNE